ncbi:hypothetical protein ABEV55_14620 [Aneurinibacillus thermoaerophilus]|uniref:hypothetical protein n=1 Tax=Aneurinibacillus thermoaerophilus TaxID=143495 RepID=UPI002E1E8DD9|nr:hypothetical protein [Aneurinibacillus thermoaerophilus]
MVKKILSTFLIISMLTGFSLSASAASNVEQQMVGTGYQNVTIQPYQWTQVASMGAPSGNYIIGIGSVGEGVRGTRWYNGYNRSVYYTSKVLVNISGTVNTSSLSARLVGYLADGSRKEFLYSVATYPDNYDGFQVASFRFGNNNGDFYTDIDPSQALAIEVYNPTSQPIAVRFNNEKYWNGEFWHSGFFNLVIESKAAIQPSIDAKAARIAAEQASQNASNAKISADTAANNALNAKVSADSAKVSADIAANRTIYTGGGEDNNKTAATLSKEAKDKAIEAYNRVGLAETNINNAINNSNNDLTSKINNLHNNLNDTISNLQNNINESITNIQNSMSPVLIKVSGYKQATATRGSTFNVSLAYSGATQYRYKIDDSDSWSAWTSLEAHDKNGYFTASGISGDGMHTIFVEIRNSQAGPTAKGKITIFKL